MKYTIASPSSLSAGLTLTCDESLRLQIAAVDPTGAFALDVASSASAIGRTLLSINDVTTASLSTSLLLAPDHPRFVDRGELRETLQQLGRIVTEDELESIFTKHATVDARGASGPLARRGSRAAPAVDPSAYAIGLSDMRELVRGELLVWAARQLDAAPRPLCVELSGPPLGAAASAASGGRGTAVDVVVRTSGALGITLQVDPTTMNVELLSVKEDGALATDADAALGPGVFRCGDRLVAIDGIALPTNFSFLDADHSGEIDARELTAAWATMGQTLSEAAAAAMVQTYDLDRSGAISAHEFLPLAQQALLGLVMDRVAAAGRPLRLRIVTASPLVAGIGRTPLVSPDRAALLARARAVQLRAAAMVAKVTPTKARRSLARTEYSAAEGLAPGRHASTIARARQYAMEAREGSASPPKQALDGAATEGRALITPVLHAAAPPTSLDDVPNAAGAETVTMKTVAETPIAGGEVELVADANATEAKVAKKIKTKVKKKKKKKKKKGKKSIETTAQPTKETAFVVTAAAAPIPSPAAERVSVGERNAATAAICKATRGHFGAGVHRARLAAWLNPLTSAPALVGSSAVSDGTRDAATRDRALVRGAHTATAATAASVAASAAAVAARHSCLLAAIAVRSAGDPIDANRSALARATHGAFGDGRHRAKARAWLTEHDIGEGHHRAAAALRLRDGLVGPRDDVSALTVLCTGNLGIKTRALKRWKDVSLTLFSDGSLRGANAPHSLLIHGSWVATVDPVDDPFHELGQPRSYPTPSRSNPPIVRHIYVVTTSACEVRSQPLCAASSAERMRWLMAFAAAGWPSESSLIGFESARAAGRRRRKREEETAVNTANDASAAAAKEKVGESKKEVGEHLSTFAAMVDTELDEMEMQRQLKREAMAARRQSRRPTAAVNQLFSAMVMSSDAIAAPVELEAMQTTASSDSSDGRRRSAFAPPHLRSKWRSSATPADLTSSSAVPGETALRSTARRSVFAAPHLRSKWRSYEPAAEKKIATVDEGSESGSAAATFWARRGTAGPAPGPYSYDVSATYWQRRGTAGPMPPGPLPARLSVLHALRLPSAVAANAARKRGAQSRLISAVDHPDTCSLMIDTSGALGIELGVDHLTMSVVVIRVIPGGAVSIANAQNARQSGAAVLEVGDRIVGVASIALPSSFQFIDKDHDGTISLSELKTAFSEMGQPMSDGEAQRTFDEYDTDHNGDIDRAEFVELAIDRLLDLTIDAVASTPRPCPLAFVKEPPHDVGARVRTLAGLGVVALTRNDGMSVVNLDWTLADGTSAKLYVRSADLTEQLPSPEVSGAARSKSDHVRSAAGSRPRTAPLQSPLSQFLGVKQRKPRRMSTLHSMHPSAKAHHIEGWLLKRSKRGKWQQRFFRTQSHYLLYSKEENSPVLGGVDLAGGDSVVEATRSLGTGGIEGHVPFSYLNVSGLDSDSHHAVSGERPVRTMALRAMELQRRGGAPPQTCVTLDEWAEFLSSFSSVHRDLAAVGDDSEGESSLIDSRFGVGSIARDEVIGRIDEDSDNEVGEGDERKGDLETATSLSERPNEDSVWKRRKARRMSAIVGLPSGILGASGEDASVVNAPLIEGTLLKKSTRGAWQPRYFVVHNHYMLYSRRKGGEVLGGVDFTGPGSSCNECLYVGSDGMEYDSLIICGLDSDEHATTGEAGDHHGVLRRMELRYHYASGGSWVEPSIYEWSFALRQAVLSSGVQPHAHGDESGIAAARSSPPRVDDNEEEEEGEVEEQGAVASGGDSFDPDAALLSRARSDPREVETQAAIQRARGCLGLDDDPEQLHSLLEALEDADAGAGLTEAAFAHTVGRALGWPDVESIPAFDIGLKMIAMARLALLAEIFAAYDVNDSGSVGADELIAGFSHLAAPHEVRRVSMAVLRIYDAGGSGTLREEELVDYLTATLAMERAIGSSGALPFGSLLRPSPLGCTAVRGEATVPDTAPTSEAESSAAAARSEAGEVVQSADSTSDEISVPEQSRFETMIDAGLVATARNEASALLDHFDEANEGAVSQRQFADWFARTKGLAGIAPLCDDSSFDDGEEEEQNAVEQHLKPTHVDDTIMTPVLIKTPPTWATNAKDGGAQAAMTTVRPPVAVAASAASMEMVTAKSFDFPPAAASIFPRPPGASTLSPPLHRPQEDPPAAVVPTISSSAPVASSSMAQSTESSTSISITGNASASPGAAAAMRDAGVDVARASVFASASKNRRMLKRHTSAAALPPGRATSSANVAMLKALPETMARLKLELFELSLSDVLATLFPPAVASATSSSDGSSSSETAHFAAMAISKDNFVTRLLSALGPDTVLLDERDAIEWYFNAILRASSDPAKGAAAGEDGPTAALPAHLSTVSRPAVTAALSMMCVANHSTTVIEVFRVFDDDHDGTLSREEVKKYLHTVCALVVRLRDPGAPLNLHTAGKHAAMLTDDLFDYIDADHSGTIEPEEFEQWLVSTIMGRAPMPTSDAAASSVTRAASEEMARKRSASATRHLADARKSASDADTLDNEHAERLGDELAVLHAELYSLALPRVIAALFPKTVAGKAGMVQIDRLTKDAWCDAMGAVLGADSEVSQIALVWVHDFIALLERSDAKIGGTDTGGAGELEVVGKEAAVSIAGVTAALASFCVSNLGAASAEVFRVFDTNADGQLSRDECAKFLRTVIALTIRLKDLAGMS